MTVLALGLAASACDHPNEAPEHDASHAPEDARDASADDADQVPLPPLQMTASYAGNAPYPCIEVSSSTAALVGSFACPAALGSDHGAGVYEVVARGGGRLFRGTYERTFNGCTASEGALILDEVDTNAAP